jgi:hypothetical protein
VRTRRPAPRAEEAKDLQSRRYEHLDRRRHRPAWRGKGVSAAVRGLTAGIGTLTVSRSRYPGIRSNHYEGPRHEKSKTGGFGAPQTVLVVRVSWQLVAMRIPN